ncbi:MAG: amidohydrolase [Flavobacteriales bacterium]|nr:amidohydrolase [Flavobacteriales bacterium]
MKNLRITLCQVNIEWKAKASNLSRYAELLAGLKDKTDLIILPETFTTGFSMDAPELAEDMDGKTVDWMKQQAAKLNASIMASFLCKADGKMHNRSVLVAANGEFEHYDKRHLFSFAKEDKHFSAGNKRKIIEHNDWRIMPQVCYDLRFPVFSRNQKNDRYDMLIYVANWPAARSSAWKALLVARAHENQCFVIGVNRVGKDGNGIAYNGNSMVISPKGEILLSFKQGEEAMETIELDKTVLDNFRAKFCPLDDADNFELIS